MPRKLLLLLSFIIYFFTIPTFARLPRYWLNIAMGVGGSRNVSGISGDIGANLRIKQKLLLTLRTARVTDKSYITGNTIACALSGVSNCYNEIGYVADVGGLIGYIQQGRYGFGSIAAGISYVQSRKLNNGVHKFKTVGLPLEAQTFWTPFTYLGFGVIAFADFNFQLNFGGIALAIQLKS